jgi:hypothetical protein
LLRVAEFQAAIKEIRALSDYDDYTPFPVKALVNAVCD